VPVKQVVPIRQQLASNPFRRCPHASSNSRFRASILSRGCLRTTTSEVQLRRRDHRGGGHGLAAAYYLPATMDPRRGDPGEELPGQREYPPQYDDHPLQLPDTGRVQFYDESVRLWRDLSEDFDLNLFFSTRGHFTLAHTDAAMRTMRWRAEVNKHYGIASEAVDSQACMKRFR